MGGLQLAQGTHKTEQQLSLGYVPYANLTIAEHSPSLAFSFSDETDDRPSGGLLCDTQVYKAAVTPRASVRTGWEQLMRQSHCTAQAGREFGWSPGWPRTLAPPASGSWKQLVSGLGVRRGH